MHLIANQKRNRFINIFSCLVDEKALIKPVGCNISFFLSPLLPKEEKGEKESKGKSESEDEVMPRSFSFPNDCVLHKDRLSDLFPLLSIFIAWYGAGV